MSASPPDEQRALITGGGTGGHLYPAIAIIQNLKERIGTENILYIGNQSKAEATLIPKMGIAFHGIQFEGLKKSFRLILWPGLLFKETYKLLPVLKHFKPSVVFATGGYVIAPVIMAAILLNIPFVLHEPDAHPGKANKLFAPWAKVITCGFEAALTVFGQKAICTGNPIRADFGKISKENALHTLKIKGWDLNKKTILVIGGSQGARKINDAILAIHHQLAEKYAVQILHQTGEKLFEECVAQFDNHTPPHYYHIQPFISDMADAYTLADIVISRAGAMSLAEIFASGIPAILIPYPYATADHQRKNAEAVMANGAAVMILDSMLTEQTLQQQLEMILNDTNKQQTMHTAALNLSKPQATDTVSKIILSVAISSTQTSSI